MQFDIIIGNPPYSDRTNADCGGKGGGANNLDSAFVMKSIELLKPTGRVSLIIRAKHFIRDNSNFRRTLFESQHLTQLKYVHPSNFPQVQNTQTIIVSYEPTHNGPCEVTYDDYEVVPTKLDRSKLIKLNNKDFEFEVPNNMLHRHMYGKGMRYQIKDCPGGVPLVEIMGRGDSPVMREVSPDDDYPGEGLHGVLMNYNATWTNFGRMHIKDPSWRLCGSVVLIQTADRAEAERLLEYLKTDDVLTIAKRCKRSFANSKYLFRLIPYYK